MGVHVKKTVAGKGTAHERVVSDHPANGLASVSRVHVGGGMHLFNSPLKHHHAIRVSVTRAKAERSLHSDHLSSTSRIVDFYMSEAQWAQFVSSIGHGAGTPITLDYAPPEGVKPERIPSIEPDDGLKDTFSSEMKEKAERYVKDSVTVIKRLQLLVDSPGAVSKTELKQLVRDLSLTFENLPGNLKFTQDQFAKAVEKTVEAGKAEIDGFLKNALMRAGMEHVALGKPVTVIAELVDDPKKIENKP